LLLFLKDFTSHYFFLKYIMRVITKEQQEEAGNYAMKGFAIGAAQWACVGVFATAAASVAFPGFKRTPIQNKVMIPQKRMCSICVMILTQCL
jgi:hypothetical protein